MVGSQRGRRRLPADRVAGAENLPNDRPAILAANHGNALGDIAVIVAKMPRFPQFLAASSWWKSAPARVLFRLGGVVPIHRRRDGTDRSRNASTFEACYAALVAGAHIAIFPEGELHNEPALMPLKTGAARIALGAAADVGVCGVVLVPVGMVYEARGRFRSDVEIRFGDPIEVDEWTDRARADPDKVAREVTDLLADRLAEVTVNHGSHDEAELVDRAVGLLMSDVSLSYSRRNELRRALAAALATSTGEDGSAQRVAGRRGRGTRRRPRPTRLLGSAPRAGGSPSRRTETGTGSTSSSPCSDRPLRSASS